MYETKLKGYENCFEIATVKLLYEQRKRSQLNWIFAPSSIGEHLSTLISLALPLRYTHGVIGRHPIERIALIF